MLIPLQHQRKVILFDPMWPLSNACHWPYSYVYIMSLEESSWIFMTHCNWMLSMKWNTALLDSCLPWDTNLNLHIVRCIQIEALQAWTQRLLQSTGLFDVEDSLSEYVCTLFLMLGNPEMHFWCFYFYFFWFSILVSSILLCLIYKLN